MGVVFGSRSKRAPASLTVLAALATLIVACGSSGGGSGSGGTAAGGAGGTAAGSTDTVTVKGVKFPKPELSKVTVSLASEDVGSMPSYYIEQQHFDQLFGMSVDFKLFKGAAPAIQALVAGQAGASSSAGAYTMTASGKPAESVYLILSALNYSLVAKDSIKTAADLKGKNIGVSSAGSESYAVAVLTLKSLGLTPKDVTITYIGGQSDRIAAVKSGGIDASVFDPAGTQTVTGAGSGYHVLVDLNKVKNDGYPAVAVTVLKSYAQKYPNTVLALAAMYQMGVHAFLHNSLSQNAAIWAKVSGKSAADASNDVQTFKETTTWRPVDGRCDASVAFQKTILEKVNSKVASIDPADVCTNKFVDKLKSLGFQKAIGVPGY